MKKLLMILLLALLTININCGGGSGSKGSAGTSLVTINVGNSSSGQAMSLIHKKSIPYVGIAAIPSNVYKIVFTIAAPGMPTITKEVLVAGQASITESFSIPNGNNRYFLVEAKNASGDVLYRGDITANLFGEPVTLIIYMSALDTTPPTVISTSPANSATGVPITSAIIITFSETIDTATFNSSTFTLRNNGNNVAGTITVNGALVTFTPLSALSYSTTYTGTITTGVQDLAGNAMAVNYIWSFTTGAAPDTTPPTVTAVSPGIGATDVPVTSTLTATFSDAMDASTINTSTFTLSGSSPVSGTVTYAGTTATLTPSSNLAYNTTYTATITTGVKDLAGNAMAANYTWSFTTGAVPDTTPPTVSSTSPANNATGVAVNTAITATFSETMTASTITTATFTLSGGVTGTVTYAGTTATFTPSANLAYNTIYTATITTGARDIAGNALTANYSWTFRTPTTAFVTNYSSNTVSVININNNTVVATIGVGTNPYGVVVNPVNKRAYVANYGISSNVSVIDATTNTVVATIPTINVATPYGIAVNPNNNMIYVTEEYDHDIDYINGATNTVASILNVTLNYDFGIAINPNTNIAYVADWGDLYKINTLTNVVVGPIGGLAFGTSTSAFGVAVDPINNKVYVTDTSSTGVVNVLSTITDTIIATVNVGMDPEGVALHQTASRAYVANSGTNNVSVIDTTTNTVIATMTVGTEPTGVAVTP